MTDAILEIEWMREVHYRGDRSWMSPKLDSDEMDTAIAAHTFSVKERRGGIYELTDRDRVWWVKVAKETPMVDWIYSAPRANMMQPNMLLRPTVQGSTYSAEDFDDAMWVRRKGGTIEKSGGHYTVSVPGLGTFVDVNLREIVLAIGDKIYQQKLGERGY